MKTFESKKNLSSNISRRLVLLMFLALNIFCANGQCKISGKVTDRNDNSPLLGATVVLKGTSAGVVTDINGFYSITIAEKKNAILVFSYIGYESEEIKVADSDTINASLVASVSSLEEVVVVGYGVMKKSMITSAISRVEDSFSSFAAVEESSSDEAMVYNEVEPSHSQPAIAAGVLTAGEVNDFTKWELWKDIDETDLNQWQTYWQIKPMQRFTVQLTNLAGKPVIDATITLKNPESMAIWTSRTDNTGKAELWAGIFDTTSNLNLKYCIAVNYKNRSYSIPKARLFRDGINVLQIPETCLVPNQLDAVFVVDATGSMGDEIEYLKAELNNVIEQVKVKQGNLSIRLGSVFYRDHGDEYITRKSDLSEDISQTVNFIKAQHADGGGDAPEAMDEALEMAVNNMSWNETARARLLFLVLDAPPHYNKEILDRIKRATKIAAEKGIRIVPITGSGIDKSTEYLMRAMALTTNGTYTFLTNHSGVGNPHIEPTTDKYDVEFLNQLLERLFYEFTETPNCEDIGVSDTLQHSDTLIVINNKALIVDSLPVTEIEDTTQRYNFTEIPANLLKSWKYYPNPTNGPINIEIEGRSNMFYLADISGKILERIDIRHKRSIAIDIHQYPSGIYFIKYQLGEKWLSGKVVLRH